MNPELKKAPRLYITITKCFARFDLTMADRKRV
jgi:hypothetical protein